MLLQNHPKSIFKSIYSKLIISYHAFLNAAGQTVPKYINQRCLTLARGASWLRGFVACTKASAESWNWTTAIPTSFMWWLMRTRLKEFPGEKRIRKPDPGTARMDAYGIAYGITYGLYGKRFPNSRCSMIWFTNFEMGDFSYILPEDIWRKHLQYDQYAIPQVLKWKTGTSRTGKVFHDISWYFMRHLEDAPTISDRIDSYESISEDCPVDVQWQRLAVSRWQVKTSNWVNFITTSLFSRALESWFILGESSPFMAELFRLVKYYNLPRSKTVRSKNSITPLEPHGWCHVSKNNMDRAAAFLSSQYSHDQYVNLLPNSWTVH